jgi:hypothetical protein
LIIIDFCQAKVQVLETANKQLVEEKKIQEDKWKKLEKEIHEKSLKRVGTFSKISQKINHYNTYKEIARKSGSVHRAEIPIIGGEIPEGNCRIKGFWLELVEEAIN